MTGEDFVLYVKAKLNRIDTSSWEDVRSEEVLFFATEALKKLSVKFDTGMIQPTIDEHTRQAYLASITKIVEIDLLNNEQILPLLIKIKDVYVHVLCGDFTDWEGSTDVVISTPVANAGVDQEIELPTRAANLDASLSSDAFSPITTYLWEINAGSIDDSGSITPVWILPDTPGTYTATLTVTNAIGTSDSDSMQVIVTAQPVWYNAKKSETFTKNDCPLPVYYNAEASQTFTKNDCVTPTQYSSTETSGTASKECSVDTNGNPKEASSETYVVPAGSYTSNTSQADADARAQQDVDANKQDYANSTGTCTATYPNVEKSGTATKSDCGTGEGSTETYTVPAGTYTSNDSQAAADSQADFDVAANKQSYADSNGSCTYYNTEQSQVFRKNNCNAT